MDVSLSELREMVTDREAWHAAIHGAPGLRIARRKLRIKLFRDRGNQGPQRSWPTESTVCSPFLHRR